MLVGLPAGQAEGPSAANRNREGNESPRFAVPGGVSTWVNVIPSTASQALGHGIAEVGVRVGWLGFGVFRCVGLDGVPFE